MATVGHTVAGRQVAGSEPGAVGDGGVGEEGKDLHRVAVVSCRGERGGDEGRVTWPDVPPAVLPARDDRARCVRLVPGALGTEQDVDVEQGPLDRLRIGPAAAGGAGCQPRSVRRGDGEAGLVLGARQHARSRVVGGRRTGR